MIKVGDEVTFNNEKYYVDEVHNPVFHSSYEVAHLLISNKKSMMRLPLAAYYRDLYEQQKQRADEAERQIEILNSEKETLSETMRFYFNVNVNQTNTIEELQQRADYYEKRWNELKEKLNSVFEKNETHFLEDMTYADVLEMMNELEDDNE